MVGNGNIAFTADITGLQTFPGAVLAARAADDAGAVGLAQLSESEGFTIEQAQVPVQVRGKTQQVPVDRRTGNRRRQPRIKWLRENPHASRSAASACG